MRNFSELAIYIQQVSKGRWLAATGVAPYFCFEADSREHVVETAKRALQFYASVRDRLEAQIETKEREQA